MLFPKRLLGLSPYILNCGRRQKCQKFRVPIQQSYFDLQHPGRSQNIDHSKDQQWNSTSDFEPKPSKNRIILLQFRESRIVHWYCSNHWMNLKIRKPQICCEETFMGFLKAPQIRVRVFGRIPLLNYHGANGFSGDLFRFQASIHRTSRMRWWLHWRWRHWEGLSNRAWQQRAPKPLRMTFHHGRTTSGSLQMDKAFFCGENIRKLIRTLTNLATSFLREVFFFGLIIWIFST